MSDMTNAVTVHTVESKAVTEKVVKESGWATVSVTLWPVAALLIALLFRKQLGRILDDLGSVTFGSFTFRLRRRMAKSTTPEQYERMSRLNSYDLKFFFVLASQSWQIKQVTWKLDPSDSLRVHEKLESVGLITILNRETAVADTSVNSKLTPLGEDFYAEITSLIAESIR